MDYVFDIENSKTKAITKSKEYFLKHFGDKEQMKSVLKIMLLMYKDVLNYKLFQKMEYFNNEVGLKQISDTQEKEIIIKSL